MFLLIAVSTPKNTQWTFSTGLQAS